MARSCCVSSLGTKSSLSPLRWFLYLLSLSLSLYNGLLCSSLKKTKPATKKNNNRTVESFPFSLRSSSSLYHIAHTSSHTHRIYINKKKNGPEQERRERKRRIEDRRGRPRVGRRRGGKDPGAELSSFSFITPCADDEIGKIFSCSFFFDG